MKEGDKIFVFNINTPARTYKSINEIIRVLDNFNGRETFRHVSEVGRHAESFVERMKRINKKLYSED